MTDTNATPTPATATPDANPQTPSSNCHGHHGHRCHGHGHHHHGCGQGCGNGCGHGGCHGHGRCGRWLWVLLALAGAFALGRMSTHRCGWERSYGCHDSVHGGSWQGGPMMHPGMVSPHGPAAPTDAPAKP